MPRPSPYKSKVVVQLPDDYFVKKVIGKDFDPSKFLNVMRLFAASEEMYDGLVSLGKAIFTSKDIDEKILQIITLRTAALLNVPYEWAAHETMAINVGLSEDEIEATAVAGPVTGIGDDYVLICEAVDEMILKGTLTDETLQKLLNRFGNKITIKYIVTISSFSMLSLMLNAARVPMEETDKFGTRSTPKFI